MSTCSVCGVSVSTAFCTECGAAARHEEVSLEGEIVAPSLAGRGTSETAPTSFPPGWYSVEGGRQRWWSGSQWGDYAPTTPPSSAQVSATSIPVPGRVSGFVLGLISLLIAGGAVTMVFSIAMAVVGWALAATALRQLKTGVPGRALAVWGVVLSVVALVVNTLAFLSFLAG